MEIILVNNPPAYGQQVWVDNIKHMLDRVGEEYDAIHVMDDVVHGTVYDKLVLFDRFRTGQYLYLDLDVVITSTISHLCRTEFTLLNAWWRPCFWTPLNSSIMSWSGDHSYIYKKFDEDPDYYMVKYWKGIDEFFFKEIEYETYDKVCKSYAWMKEWEQTTEGVAVDVPVILYNHDAKDKLWEHKYTLSGPETNTVHNTSATSIRKYLM